MRLAPLLAFLSATAFALPAAAFEATPLPAGIPDASPEKNACFLDGEKKAMKEVPATARIPAAGCSQGVIPPSREISGFSPYVSGNSAEGRGATYDCAKVRRSESASAVIGEYVRELQRVTDAAGADATGDAAICAANMLSLWAEAGAMEEIANQKNRNAAEKDRMWTFGGISGAYFKSPGAQEAAKSQETETGQLQHDVILSWFSTIAADVSTYADKRARDPHDRTTNIQYWNGYALLPTALLTGDQALFSHSRDIFNTAIGHIVSPTDNPDYAGYLPHELERGLRAQSYHAFALRPILGMATLSRAHGCDFLRGQENIDRLEALVERTIQGYYLPKDFAAAIPVFTDHKAVKLRVKDPLDMVYLARFVDPTMTERVEAQLTQTLDTDGKKKDAAQVASVFGDPSYGADARDDKLGGRLDLLTASAEAAQGACPFH